MNFNPPPGTAVYQRLPAGMKVATPVGYLDANLLPVPPTPFPPQPPDASLPPTIECCFAPRCLAGFLQASGTKSVFQRGDPVAFCHELCSPSGKRRLVVVRVIRGYLSECMTKFAAFQEIVYDDRGTEAAARLPWDENGPPFPGPSLIEAAQIDPRDASHFTIAYQWPDGVCGTIDGWLRDSGSVDLSVRPGPGDLMSAFQRHCDDLEEHNRELMRRLLSEASTRASPK